MKDYGFIDEETLSAEELLAEDAYSEGGGDLDEQT